jgi:hypothetical protein
MYASKVILSLSILILNCQNIITQQLYKSSDDWQTTLVKTSGEKVTKRMLLDPDAKSTDTSKPAFISPPPDSKPYYGFPLITETTTAGFTMGSITDFLEKDSDEGCTIGDAFVEGPDGTRAGITWEVGKEFLFMTIVEPDSDRWGVYIFTVRKAVTSIADFKDNFRLMLPKIKQLYQQTRQ